MVTWIIVRKGDELVTNPKDPRLVDIVKIDKDAHKLDAAHPTIFDTVSARAERALKEKYAGQLFPDGEYRILNGETFDIELTSSALKYMQD
jgi:hypothetical protein